MAPDWWQLYGMGCMLRVAVKVVIRVEMILGPWMRSDVPVVLPVEELPTMMTLTLRDFAVEACQSQCQCQCQCQLQ